MIITKAMLNEAVPHEIFPTRLDSALNLLTCFKYRSQEALVLYNTNPETWNTLYPFYEMNHKFTMDEYEFSKKNLTYGELIQEYQVVYQRIWEQEHGVTKEKRKKILIEEFQKTFSLESASIACELEPIFELKYSKSKNVWTLYSFENYVLGEVKNGKRLLSQSVYDQYFLSLQQPTDEIETIPVVSNLVYLLENSEIVSILKQHCINDEE